MTHDRLTLRIERLRRKLARWEDFSVKEIGALFIQLRCFERADQLRPRQLCSESTLIIYLPEGRSTALDIRGAVTC